MTPPNISVPKLNVGPITSPVKLSDVIQYFQNYGEIQFYDIRCDHHFHSIIIQFKNVKDIDRILKRRYHRIQKYIMKVDPASELPQTSVVKNNVAKTVSFVELNNSLLTKIFNHLCVNDLCSVANTCIRFQKIAHQNFSDKFNNINWCDSNATNVLLDTILTDFQRASMAPLVDETPTLSTQTDVAETVNVSKEMPWITRSSKRRVEHSKLSQGSESMEKESPVDDDNSTEAKRLRIEDKNTNKALTTKSKQCTICNKKVKTNYLSSHYADMHEGHEVFSARMSAEYSDKLRRIPPKNATFKNAKFTAYCYYCEKDVTYERSKWISHFIRHTGEYTRSCTKCGIKRTANTDKNDICAHSGEILPLVEFKDTIYVHMCNFCNYTQYQEENMNNHIRNMHGINLNVTGQFIKINLIPNFREATESMENFEELANQDMFEPSNQDDDVLPDAGSLNSAFVDRMTERFKKRQNAPFIKEEAIEVPEIVYRCADEITASNKKATIEPTHYHPLIDVGDIKNECKIEVIEMEANAISDGTGGLSTINVIKTDHSDDKEPMVEVMPKTEPITDDESTVENAALLTDTHKNESENDTMATLNPSETDSPGDCLVAVNDLHNTKEQVVQQIDESNNNENNNDDAEVPDFVSETNESIEEIQNQNDTTDVDPRTCIPSVKRTVECLDPSTNDDTRLHVAASQGCDEKIENLIDRGAEIDSKDINGLTPNHSAARNGLDKTVEFLIRSKVDLNYKNKCGRTPLHWAARSGRDETVKLLIDSGADVNSKDKDGWTPLHFAANNVHIEAMKILIGGGADVNHKDIHGRTPLHLAAPTGLDKTIKLLIDSGADVNCKNKKEETPLHYAARNGHDKTAEVLINSKAYMNCKNRAGYTPLHSAARSGHDETVEFLIDRGADVNCKNKGGWTPLHFAAQNGYDEIVKVLVKNGANIRVTNKHWKTPIDVVSRKCKSGTLALLTQ